MRYILIILNYLLLFELPSLVFVKGNEEQEYKRIAIIGAGISGNFAAKYLSDYDDKCLLDITIFSPTNSTIDGISKGVAQGSRVSSTTLADGTVVELGASIIFEGNKLVNEMIDGDEDLIKVKPYSPGRNVTDEERMATKEGFGIFNGKSNDIPWALLLTNMTSEESKKKILWRYNLDLWRLHRATNKALESFTMIYDLIDSTHEATFFDSPNDVWRAVGLAHAASVSFDEYLDYLGVSSHIAWWKDLFGGQGLMRSEFQTAVSICNNNQLNSQMTGLAGLVNSAATTGTLFSIKGGNDKLLDSAFRQAKKKHDQVCRKKDMYGESKIRHITKTIKTFVSEFEHGIELFDAQGKSLGTFEVVILAAPLQFSGINFLGKGSMFDSSVLHSISLNEMVDSDNSDANEHGHRHAIGAHLPSSATRPYTEVFTTVISNAHLDASQLSLEEEKVPRSILFTKAGREETGISSIGQITAGVFKVFSSNELTDETVSNFFGRNAVVEEVKVWGGRDGGATPAFNGGGESSYSSRFNLYDGGHGTSSSTLYYTNAMESAVSAIEISAIGSKFVSKLIAQRLGLIEATSTITEDEL